MNRGPETGMTESDAVPSFDVHQSRGAGALLRRQLDWTRCRKQPLAKSRKAVCFSIAGKCLSPETPDRLS
jgi:hypothetical protein